MTLSAQNTPLIARERCLLKISDMSTFEPNSGRIGPFGHSHTTIGRPQKSWDSMDTCSSLGGTHKVSAYFLKDQRELRASFFLSHRTKRQTISERSQHYGDLHSVILKANVFCTLPHIY